MDNIRGTKEDLPIHPAPEAGNQLSMREKIIGGTVVIISALMVYKGLKPSFEPPYAVDADWLISGGIGLTAIARYNQTREQPEQE